MDSKTALIIGSGTREQITPVDMITEEFGTGYGDRHNLHGGGLSKVLNLRTGLLEKSCFRI